MRGNRDPWRAKRREDVRKRKALGQPVTRQRFVCHVKTNAIPVPDWARLRAVRGLSESDDAVWLSRRDAFMLAQLDREAGGTPEVTEVEYRLCDMCHRPLLAEDAEDRRALNESDQEGRRKPCGSECYAAARDGRWKRSAL